MDSKFSKEEIIEEVERLAPFHHKIDLPYGLSTYIPKLSRKKSEYTRLPKLVENIFPIILKKCGGSFKGKRVLDIACNCGGISIEALKHGSEYVLGIDIVEKYIEQANFIRKIMNLDNIDFKEMDLNSISSSSIGSFNLTFCFGILYHLENPISSLKKIASVTKDMLVIDTRVITVPFFLKPFFDNSLWRMNFPQVTNNESLTVSTSLWRNQKRVVQFTPNVKAVVEILQFLGFPNIEVISHPNTGVFPRYSENKRAAIIASRF